MKKKNIYSSERIKAKVINDFLPTSKNLHLHKKEVKLYEEKTSRS